MRERLAAIVAALAGLLAAPAIVVDLEPARCVGAVAVAYASLASDVAPTPAPPKPEPPCGGKCNAGTYKPDGRIEARCGKDCQCGCVKTQDAQRCRSCLGTGNVMGGDGVVRRCTACVNCTSGTCQPR